MSQNFQKTRVQAKEQETPWDDRMEAAEEGEQPDTPALHPS